MNKKSSKCRCHRSLSASAILGIADSEGNVTLHEWQDEQVLEVHPRFLLLVTNTLQRTLKQVHSIRCASTDTLCLSLDWSNRRTLGTYGDARSPKTHTKIHSSATLDPWLSLFQTGPSVSCGRTAELVSPRQIHGMHMITSPGLQPGTTGTPISFIQVDTSAS